MRKFLGAPAEAEYEIVGARAWLVDLPKAIPTTERFAFLGDLTELQEALVPAKTTEVKWLRVP